MRNLVSVSCFFCLSLIACTTGDPAAPAMPPEFAARAEAHVTQIAKAGLAYYDVEILVDGAPAGHVVLSTGAGEQRVVSFATEGRAPIVELADRARAEGKQPARLLRVASQYAVEDVDGAIVASTLPSEAAWRELEERPAVTPTDPRLVAYSVEERNCGVPEAPSYDQLSPGEPGNTWSYFSGCGATAWAMSIAPTIRRSTARSHSRCCASPIDDRARSAVA